MGKEVEAVLLKQPGISIRMGLFREKRVRVYSVASHGGGVEYPLPSCSIVSV